MESQRSIEKLLNNANYNKSYKEISNIKDISNDKIIKNANKEEKNNLPNQFKKKKKLK